MFSPSGERAQCFVFNLLVDKMKFADFQTRTKLFFGFGMVLFFTIVVGVTGYMGINGLHQFIMLKDEVAQNNVKWVTARLAVENYSRYGNLDDYNKAQGLINEIGASTQGILLRIDEDQVEMLRIFNNLGKGVEEYVTRFNQLHELKAKRSKVFVDGLALANALTEKAKTLSDDRFRADFAELRSISNSYFRTEDHAYYEKTRERGSELIQKYGAADRRGLLIADYLSGVLEEGKKVVEEDKAILISLLTIGESTINESFKLNEVFVNMELQIHERVITTLLIIATLSIIIGLLIANYLANRIVKSVSITVNAIESVSKGELFVEIPAEAKTWKDEFGTVIRSVSTMIERLRDISSVVIAGTDSIAAASFEMQATSQSLSQSANEGASSTEEVSSSMEEMAANIEQNTESSKQAEIIATDVAQSMDKLGEATGESFTATQEIAQKISIINDIAFQTNILALNAAVEAARAGDHGRGFAVVASEVRNLAQRSKTAADEIVALSSKGVNLAREAGEMMVQFTPQIQRLIQLVQEIASASFEQDSGAAQINNAIQQLNLIVQQNAAASEEVATSADEMSRQADQLRESMTFFKLSKEYVNLMQAQQKQAQYTAHKIYTGQPVALKHKVNQTVY